MKKIILGTICSAFLTISFLNFNDYLERTLEIIRSGNETMVVKGENDYWCKEWIPSILSITYNIVNHE